jgi:translation initiation factor 5
MTAATVSSGAGGGSDCIKDARAGKTANGDDDLLNGHGSHGDASDYDDDGEDASEAGVVDDAGARLLEVEATTAYVAASPEASDKEVAAFVANLQVASALKPEEQIYIVVHAVFTPDFFRNKEARKFAPLLSRVTHGSRSMERHMVGALEALCADRPRNFAVLIKQLYDEDALDEGTILEWAGEGGRSEYTREEVDEETRAALRAALRAAAEPVVVWLREADSDSDDADDD